MMFSFVLWFLLIARIAAQPVYLEKLISNVANYLNYCDFDENEKNYNSTDLLECMNAIALNSFVRGSGKSIRGNYRLPQPSRDESTNYFSLNNIASMLFNGNTDSLYQFPSLLNDPVPSYQQSNYPATQVGSSESSGGIRIDLFDALTSISRYDDLKCVPRILCEMASGAIRGGSIYRQASSFLGNLGANSLIGMLTNIDLSGTSPVLHFGKATLLGYANRGNPGTCYQAYPKCPRSSTGLIHYLNNHNGGFFRFFSAANRPTYARPTYHRQSVAEHLAVGKGQSKLPVAYDFSSDRTGTGELKFDTEISLNEQTSFTEERIRNDPGKIAFPDEQREVSPGNREKKYLFDLPETENENLSAENFLTFPEAYENSNMLSLEDQFPEKSPRVKLRFPDDEDLPNYRESRLYQGHDKRESSIIKFPEEENTDNQPSKFFPDKYDTSV